jgi:hypothetical protein
MCDSHAGSVGILVTSVKTVEEDLSKRSSIMKIGEKTMQQEEDLVSTPSFLQPDEKEQWEDYTPDLERHNERLNW